jgi:hypothetical protein
MSQEGSAPVALSIVGPGKAGASIAAAATRAGIEVSLSGRGEAADLDRACVLLCVPDSEIATVAASIGSGDVRPRLVGHVSGATPLEAREYAGLRSLALDDGHRSLFGEDALVFGTERSERFLLWPMGVPSAGAMRQWGHHATAFVGRRHFDDPGLVEAGFHVGPADE